MTEHSNPAHRDRRVAARAEGLTKTYGTGDATVTALDDVTVELYAGEFTAVMGPSGSGKSTLMHCFAALDSATGGSVFVGDTELNRLGDKELTRLRRDVGKRQNWFVHGADGYYLEQLLGSVTFEDITLDEQSRLIIAGIPRGPAKFNKIPVYL